MSTTPRGKAFQTKFMLDGTLFRKTFDTRSEGELWEDQVRLAHRHGTELPTTTNGKSETGAKLESLGSLFDHTEKHVWGVQKGSYSQTINGRSCVENLGRNKQVSEIDKYCLQTLCTAFLDSGNCQATVNKKMSAMSRMLTEALDHGVIDRKPKIPKRKEYNAKINFFTEADEYRLREMFEHLGMPEMAEFLTFGVDTGCRLAEMLRVRYDHVNVNARGVQILSIWESKNETPRSLPLTARAAVVLERQAVRYPNGKGPFSHFRGPKYTGTGSGGNNAGYDGILTLKTRLREDWNTVNEQTGVNRRIHDMRHTCASRLVQRGIDLRRVQTFLGHKTITTTLRYAHLAPDDLEVCAAALEKEKVRAVAA